MWQHSTTRAFPFLPSCATSKLFNTLGSVSEQKDVHSGLDPGLFSVTLEFQEWHSDASVKLKSHRLGVMFIIPLLWVSFSHSSRAYWYQTGQVRKTPLQCAHHIVLNGYLLINKCRLNSDGGENASKDKSRAPRRKWQLDCEMKCTLSQRFAY